MAMVNTDKLNATDWPPLSIQTNFKARLMLTNFWPIGRHR